MYEKVVCFHFYNIRTVALGVCMFSDMHLYERERSRDSLLQDHPLHPEGKLLV